MTTNLEQKIKSLRNKGYSYNLIVKELGCAKSTVAYHCGKGQREKAKSRRFLRKDKQARENRAHKKLLQEISYRYKALCGCKHCGIKNPIVLQYDHLDKSTKICTIAQMISDRYGMKMFKDEIRKCQVLCSNCHLIKTASNHNYYSYSYKK